MSCSTDAVRANIENTVARLRESPILRELEESAKLVIVGAHYALDTGVVDFMMA